MSDLMDWRERAAAAGRPGDVRYRDGWRCTATVEPREVRPGFWFPPTSRRCGVVGSEMVVVDGQTYCPRHVPIQADARTQSSEPGAEGAHKPDQTPAVEGRGATNG